MTRSIFYQKLRKACLRSHWQFQHDPTYSSACIANILGGGCRIDPPVRVKVNFQDNKYIAKIPVSATNSIKTSASLSIQTLRRTTAVLDVEVVRAVLEGVCWLLKVGRFWKAVGRHHWTSTSQRSGDCVMVTVDCWGGRCRLSFHYTYSFITNGRYPNARWMSTFRLSPNTKCQLSNFTNVNKNVSPRRSSSTHQSINQSINPMVPLSLLNEAWNMLKHSFELYALPCSIFDPYAEDRNVV